MRFDLGRAVLIAAILAVLASSVMAAPPPGVPHQFAYQGRLTDNIGAPVPDGYHQVVFRVYDSTSAEPAYEIWSSGKVEVATVGGLFSINLGAAPQPEPNVELFGDSSLWLGISVGDDPELVPRTKLTSVPFAFKAEQANLASSVAPNSVSSGGIIDEPGIAAAQSLGTTMLTADLVFVDILSVGITIPGPGYIVVDAKCAGRLEGAGTGSYIGGVLCIDETGGVPHTEPYMTWFYHSSTAPEPINLGFPVSAFRIYYKSVAGTYTFHLNGSRYGLTNPNYTASVSNCLLKATYYPTSYGSVATLVASNEAGQFDNAESISVPSGTDGKGPAATMYKVDLRELELRAAKLRAETEKAERELAEAKMNEMRQQQVQNASDKQ